MTRTTIGNLGRSKPKNKTDLLNNYFKEIGKVRMLTGQEKFSLGKQVQQYNSLLLVRKSLNKKLQQKCTCSEWANCAKISKTELDQIIKAGIEAKKRMIEGKLRLVVRIAKGYQNRGLELIDLCQEGAIGLTRAVDKFDPSRGYKFSTYAYHWIRQGITHAIGQKGRTIRLPMYVIEKLNNIKRSQRELSQQFRRTATTEEIAASLKMTCQEEPKNNG